MFNSPLSRFVGADEDLQDDHDATGESNADNPRPSRAPGKGAGASGSPKKRSGKYVFNKSHAADGKPTEPIHFDGSSAPSAHTPGRFKPGTSSGQGSAHENMRTNSGFGQRGGKFSDGGAESYENMRSNSRGGKSRTSTKA